MSNQYMIIYLRTRFVSIYHFLIIHRQSCSPLAYKQKVLKLFDITTKAVHTDCQSSPLPFSGITTLQYRHTMQYHAGPTYRA